MIVFIVYSPPTFLLVQGSQIISQHRRTFVPHLFRQQFGTVRTVDIVADVVWEMPDSKVVVPDIVMCGVNADVAIVELQLHAVVQQFARNHTRRTLRDPVDLLDTARFVKVSEHRRKRVADRRTQTGSFRCSPFRQVGGGFFAPFD